MAAKPDTRLWYNFGFDYQKDDPLGKGIRGLFHRFVKGQWVWDINPRTGGMSVHVESQADAMMLRLYLGDHRFYPPRYTDGCMDFTTKPPSIFWGGKFRDMTEEEVEAACEQESRELWEGVDETDDWVQYCHETRGI